MLVYGIGNELHHIAFKSDYFAYEGGEVVFVEEGFKESIACAVVKTDDRL